MFDNLVRSGTQPSQITHAFFSHPKGDHMMDYARLMLPGINPVRATGPFLQISKCLFGPDGVLARDLMEVHLCIPIPTFTRRI